MLDNEKLKCPYFLQRTLVKQARSSNRYMWKLNGPPLLRRLLWVSETGFLFNGSSHWSNPFRTGLDSAESKILLRFKHFKWCSQTYLQHCLSVKFGRNLFSDLILSSPVVCWCRAGWAGLRAARSLTVRPKFPTETHGSAIIPCREVIMWGALGVKIGARDP